MTLISLNVDPALLKKFDALAKSQCRSRTGQINHLAKEAVLAAEAEELDEELSYAD